MLRLALAFLIVTGSLHIAFAPAAQAEDGALTREMIRQEIEAYQAEDKSAMRVYWKGGPRFENGETASSRWASTAESCSTPCSSGARREPRGRPRLRLPQRLLLPARLADGERHRVRAHRLHGAVRLRDDRRPRLPRRVGGGQGRPGDCLGCLFPDFRIGHFQEPFGLAWLTSSKYFQLMAWPTPTTCSRRATTAASSSTGRVRRSPHRPRRLLRARQQLRRHPQLDRRLRHHGSRTWTPWAPCDTECRVLHLGLSGVTAGTSALPGSARAPTSTWALVIDTGVFDASESCSSTSSSPSSTTASTSRARHARGGRRRDGHGSLLLGHVPAGRLQLFGRLVRTYTRRPAVRRHEGRAAALQRRLLRPGRVELAARVSYVDLDDGDKQGGTTATSPWAELLPELEREGDVELGLGGPGERARQPASANRTAISALVARFQVHW